LAVKSDLDLEISSVGREPPFREDLSKEEEEQPLLEPLRGNY
jgi:hypothetical protein